MVYPCFFLNGVTWWRPSWIKKKMQKGDFRGLFGIRLRRCPRIIPEKISFLQFYSRFNPNALALLVNSSFRFIWIPILWVYGHYKYLNSFSAEADVIRHGLASRYVRFWYIRTVPALKGLKGYQLGKGFKYILFLMSVKMYGANTIF